MTETLTLINDAIMRRGRLLIGVVNAAKIIHMREDRALADSVSAADILLADGMSVVWASRLLGRPLPERIAGIDLMMRMFELCHRHSYRLYLLGATQEILDATTNRISREYPDISVVGAHHGYFSEHEEARIAECIREARPDILLVAMSSPKKELFLGTWSSRMNVPVCHGVGGAFDVFAGKVRRAPLSWQRLGLEWLFRTLQEPRRLWKRYLTTNIRFAVLILRELITGQRTRRTPTVVAGTRNK